MSFEKRAKVHVALIHWPVYDRAKSVVCTNVTNFDIHDIARASRTYGVESYYIVCKMKEQLSLVARILMHWKIGVGLEYNPKRASAIGMIKTSETLEQAIEELGGKDNLHIVMTTARDVGKPVVSFRELREKIHSGGHKDVLLVFGTGFGLENSLFEMADQILEPMRGASADDYRHLSVRSAVSICLDRLLGSW